jgi:CheY-like chemotaxis protein
MKKTVLIIEDDEAIRETLAELLQMEQFEIMLATNGEDGLNMLRQEKKPDVILLDLMMPIKDGFQFRAEQMNDPGIASIPVIVMSADAQIQQKADRIGGVEFLRKPPDLEEVIETVQRLAKPEAKPETKPAEK